MTASCVAHDLDDLAEDGLPSEALGRGEQSGVTMRLFKMQMIGQQSTIFCLPVLIEIAMT
jgi:hypothetical protein